MSYFTVVIPYSKKPTVWHPPSPVGPFATLTRGAFETNEQAESWAGAHLAGQPYSVREMDVISTRLLTTGEVEILIDREYVHTARDLAEALQMIAQHRHPE